MRMLSAFLIVSASMLPMSVEQDIAADIAVQASLDFARPKKPSDVCVSCNGTGVQGDGRIKKTCAACGGTGKRVVSVLCPSGKCPL